MPDQVVHPSPAELAAYGLGQLPPEKATTIERHVSECEPCCETIVGLSSDDTFVDLLKQARQAQTVQTIDHDGGATRQTSQDVPEPLAEHPRYEIIGLIGKGGMGDVYQARHRMMKRTVALKVINREFMSQPAAVERFHREVTTAAKLSHPNIVTAHDAEQAGDDHFMVMEYVDGVDLSQVVKDQGALPVSDACDYIRQAAVGLQHAHEQGMVHRDIKPHNLMLMTDGTLKILDFGLASLAPQGLSEAESVDAQSGLTAAGSIMGTPDFISPEQAADARTADIRSDIYSLGCTFYMLLTGSAPFGDGTALEKIKAHSEQQAASVSDYRNDVPDELVAIVEKMTAKNPDERFQTPNEVAVALKDFVGESSPVTETTSAPPLQRSSIFGWLSGTALLTAVVALGLFLFGRSNPDADYKQMTVFLKTGVSDEPAGDIVSRLIRTEPGRNYLRKLDAENPKLAYTEGDFARGYTSVVAFAYENRITGVSKPELMLKGWSSTTAGMATRSITPSFTLESISFDNAPDHSCRATLQYRTPVEKKLAFGLKPDSMYETKILLDDLIKGPVSLSDEFRKGMFVREASEQEDSGLSPEISRILAQSGQDEQEFQTKIHKALRLAAGIPNTQWDELASSPSPSPDIIQGDPLSMVLLSHPPEGENGKGLNDFQLLTAKYPKMSDLSKSMSLSRDDGFVSIIQSKYIKKTTLGFDAESKSLHGSVEFEAPDLYAGEVNFVLQMDGRGMKVVEFTLPQDEITIVLDEEGVWRLQSRDLKLLQGVWDVIAFTEDGEKEFAADKGVSMQIRIKGETITRIQARPNGEKSEKEWGRIELESTTNPKSIDIINPDSPDERLLGIYELEANGLKICFSEQSNVDVSQGRTMKRPTTFDAPAESNLVLLECQRVVKEPGDGGWNDATTDREELRLESKKPLGEVQTAIRKYYVEKYPLFAASINHRKDVLCTPEKLLDRETRRQIGELALNSPVSEVINSFAGKPFVTFTEITFLSKTELLETRVNLYRTGDESCRIVVTQKRRRKNANETIARSEPITADKIRKLMVTEAQEDLPHTEDFPKTSDHERLQGFWEATSRVVDGVEIERDWDKDSLTTHFFGHGIDWDIGGDEDLGDGTYRLDTSQNPKQIDIRSEYGDITRGIYELQDETLRICVPSSESDERPTSFESTPDSNTTVTTLKLLDAPVVSDRKLIQDTWRVTSGVIAGVVIQEKELKENPSLFTFDEQRLLMELGGQKEEGSYRFVNYLETPKTINIIDDEGNIRRGICDFEGRTMKLCLQDPDSEQRPTSFESTPESKTTLLTLARVPPSMTDYQRIQGTWQLTSVVEKRSTADVVIEPAEGETWTFLGSRLFKNDGTEKLETSFYLDRSYGNHIDLIDEDWNITLGSYEFMGDTLQITLSKNKYLPTSSLDSTPSAESTVFTLRRVTEATGHPKPGPSTAPSDGAVRSTVTKEVDLPRRSISPDTTSLLWIDVRSVTWEKIDQSFAGLIDAAPSEKKERARKLIDYARKQTRAGFAALEMGVEAGVELFVMAGQPNPHTEAEISDDAEDIDNPHSEVEELVQSEEGQLFIRMRPGASPTTAMAIMVATYMKEAEIDHDSEAAQALQEAKAVEFVDIGDGWFAATGENMQPLPPKEQPLDTTPFVKALENHKDASIRFAWLMDEATRFEIDQTRLEPSVALLFGGLITPLRDMQSTSGGVWLGRHPKIVFDMQFSDEARAEEFKTALDKLVGVLGMITAFGSDDPDNPEEVENAQRTRAALSLLFLKRDGANLSKTIDVVLLQRLTAAGLPWTNLLEPEHADDSEELQEFDQSEESQ